MSFLIRLSRTRFGKFLSNIAMKCWAFSGIYIIICFLLYWFYGGILAFFLLCFATTGILYRMEDQLLYHPELPAHSRVYVPAPSMFNLPYQSVYTRSHDGTMLHMFFITQPNDKIKSSPTILFLHGNAGNMGHRLQNACGLYHKLQCNILMLEYRGYGLSQGKPSENGLYMDAQAGLNFLASRTDINTNEIIVFGRSLGGAVAIDLATKFDNTEKIWCLIVENTFTSIPEMAKILIGLKLLNYLPLIFYKNKFMSLLKVKSINIPVLFISGLADTLVPPKMMEDLYNNCKYCHKRLLTIPGGTHNETWNKNDYYDNLQKFIDELRDNPPKRIGHYQIDII